MSTCLSVMLWGLRPVLFSVFHWQPVWSTKKASMTFQASTRGPWHPKGVRFARWEHGHDTLPQLVQDTPVTASLLMIVRHQRGFYRIERFPIGYEDNGLACVRVRVDMSQCRHPPWLHPRSEDKLGQAHGGVIASRQGQIHHALCTKQRVGHRKKLI